MRPRSRDEAVRHYLKGFALALAMTLVVFAIAHFRLLGQGAAIAAIALLGLLQIVMHFHYFLHIDLSSSRREDLLLVLFAALLILLMVGGGLWIMFDLNDRMMQP